MDAVWAYWTWATEEALLALWDPELRPCMPSARCAKGSTEHCTAQTGPDVLVRQVRLCPRQQPVRGLPETAPLARLHAAVGPLRPALN